MRWGYGGGYEGTVTLDNNTFLFYWGRGKEIINRKIDRLECRSILLSTYPSLFVGAKVIVRYKIHYFENVKCATLSEEDLRTFQPCP